MKKLKKVMTKKNKNEELNSKRIQEEERINKIKMKIKK